MCTDKVSSPTVPLRFDDATEPAWARSPLLASVPGICHVFTTRFGPACGELRGRLHANGSAGLALAMLVGADRLAMVRQVHGSRVVQAHDALKGQIEADAILTDEPGLAIGGLSADCAIVLVAEANGRAVGMAHAGWRGAAKCISRRLVEAMRSAFGVDSAVLTAAVGPCANACCYEVGAEVIEALCPVTPGPPEWFLRSVGGTRHLDLAAVNARQLMDAGLAPHNIAVAGVCTICDNRFFSYRREGGNAGRCAGVIARTG